MHLETIVEENDALRSLKDHNDQASMNQIFRCLRAPKYVPKSVCMHKKIEEIVSKKKLYKLYEMQYEWRPFPSL